MLIKQKVILLSRVFICVGLGLLGCTSASAATLDAGEQEHQLKSDLIVAQKSGDADKQSRLLIDLAEFYFHNFQPKKAYLLFNDLEQIAASLNKPISVIEAYRYLAQIAARKNDNRKAADYLSVVSDAVRKLRDPPLLAEVLNEQGVADARVGEFTFATQAFNESAQIAQQFNLMDIRMSALYNACKVAAEMGDGKQLSSCLPALTAQNDTMVDSAEKRERAINIGLLYQKGYRDLKMPKQWRRHAFQQFDAARSAAESANDFRIQAYALGYIAQLYVDESRFGEAEQYIKTAVELSQRGAINEAIYRFQWQYARTMRQLKRWEKAKDAYYILLATLLDQQREIISSSSDAVKDVFEPACEELIDLLVYLAGTNPSLQQSYLRDAVGVIERLRQLEFNNFYQNEIQIQATAKQELPSNIVLLYTQTFTNRTDVFYVSSDKIHHHALKMSSRLIEKHATSFYQALASSEKTTDYKILGSQWYNWLIHPAQAFLKERQIETIVFLPDYPLQILPLGAVQEGKSFLTERYGVVVGKGISLLQLQFGAEQKKNVIAIGPATTEWASFGLVSDQNNVRRVQSFDPLHKSLSVDLIHDAYVLKLGERYSDVSVMDGSGLRLSWPSIIDKPVAKTLFMQEVAEQEIVREWNSVVSLPQSVGVESIIAPMWRINDRVKSSFISIFYELYLNYGLSARDALLRAQRALISQGRHPYEWAGYSYIEG